MRGGTDIDRYIYIGAQTDRKPDTQTHRHTDGVLLRNAVEQQQLDVPIT